MKPSPTAAIAACQLGDFITLYPVPTGEFDLDKGWQSGVNGVRIRARLMNELELDVSNWEFEDVTPGRQAFTLGSIECGEHQLGVVDFVHPVWINGKPLPRTDEIRVDWAVEGTDRHGTVAADKVTSTASRATLAADALAELASEECDGKTIVFTVRGNFASAKISATLKFLPPPKTQIAFTDAFVDGDAYGVTATHPEGLATFVPGTGGSDYDKLTVSVKVNGVGKGTLQLQRRYSSQPDTFSFDDPQSWTSGDEIEFSALRDPEKADDYEPEKVSATCTVP